jgi:cell wall-active antibiotic response 4TMS protein YvqF
MTERKSRQEDNELASWWKQNESARAAEELPVKPEFAGAVAEAAATPMRGIVAILGDSRKEGRWVVPRHVRALSILGSAKVDLRDAILQFRETVIEAQAVLADIQIIVPPDVRVECDGDALLGSFTINERKRRGAGTAPLPADAPVVRVSGSAYLASVTIKVRPRK